MTKLTAPLEKSPDIATCRASRCGVNDLIFCLNEQRVVCDHALSFGDKYFCRHPQNIEIAVRSQTSAEPNPA